MKSARMALLGIVFSALVCWGVSPPMLVAGETITYSCSAQVYEAFETERLAAFTRATGIQIDLFVAPSPTCVNRLMNGVCDIASTTRGLHFSHRESGYVETAFCRDPLAIIVNATNPVDTLTKKQLRQIFSGDIFNWKHLGGADRPVVLTVPGADTGAYKNFHRQVMHMKDIKYDYTTYQSTQIIRLVKHMPGTISFIARGAVVGDKKIKAVAVDSISPTQQAYPLSQVFSFVTRGKPSGPVKAFVDFAFSDAGQAIMKKRGMVPIQ